MAVLNRRSGMVSGGFKVVQPVVGFNWKGVQMLRMYAGNILQIASEKRADVKAKLTELANRYRETLTDSQRNLWELYAGTLGSAVDREKSDNVGQSKNIIPKRKKLMTGMNAYIGTNVAAFLAGISITALDVPPLGEHTPPPPLHVAITLYDPITGMATVSWTDPTLIGTPIASKVRLWAHFQAGKKLHSQIVKYVVLPSPGSTTFDELSTGRGWANPKVKLKDFSSGILRVQMDTIVQRKAGVAPLVGPASNVAEKALS